MAGSPEVQVGDVVRVRYEARDGGQVVDRGLTGPKTVISVRHGWAVVEQNGWRSTFPVDTLESDHA